MNRFLSLFRKPVVVVSGLPRSGTSMMMKMLAAGGLALLTDGLRSPDPDNPEGYYEFERVKKLPEGDATWLGDARGKVVKVISALLRHLPPGETYRVIFMRRALPEVLASQKKMLANRGETGDAVSDAEMAALYEQHIANVLAWLRTQPNMQVLEVDYNLLVQNPRPWAERVNAFVGIKLDAEQMAGAVNPELYRQREMKKGK